MKKFHFLGLVIISFVASTMIVSCGEEDRDPSNSFEQFTEGMTDEQAATVANLVGFIDGVGSLSDCESDEDGSFVLKDNKGNTITIDQDGNAVIVDPEGSETFIDNSINEDYSSSADFIAKTVWESDKELSELNDLIIDESYYTVESLRKYGFVVEETFDDENGETDYDHNSVYRQLKFRNTTCSYFTADTLKHYNHKFVTTYLQYVIEDQEIEMDEMTHLVLKNLEDRIALYEKRAQPTYNPETGNYDLIWDEERYMTSFPLDRLRKYYSTREVSESDVFVSLSRKTVEFNYKRIASSQIYLSNNTQSYRLMEGTDYHDVPYLKMCDTKSGDEIAEFYMK